MDGSIATELEIGRVGASTALSFISSSDLQHSQGRLLHSQETASQLRIPTDFKQWQGFISSSWNHLTNDEQSPSFFNQDYLILDRMWHSHGCCLQDQAIVSSNQKPSRNETRASFWSLNSQTQINPSHGHNATQRRGIQSRKLEGTDKEKEKERVLPWDCSKANTQE